MKNRRKKREKFIYSRVSITCTNFILYVFNLPNDSSIPHVHVQMGRILKQSTICWIDNFKILWQDENFFRTIQNTILLIVVVTLFTVVLAVLSRQSFQQKRFAETTSSELFSTSLIFYQS